MIQVSKPGPPDTTSLASPSRAFSGQTFAAGYLLDGDGLSGAGLIPTMSTPRWERFEGFLWKTTSVLVLAQDQSLVVDPAISQSEVARIGRRALELDAPVRHVLITHGDWDHVCGVGGFPMRSS